jgi:hypothetical protein
MATTPLEREILTHYATTPGPYLGGSENWAEVHAKIVQHFIELRLLISHQGADGRSHLRANEEALRAYMDALAAVPLPVQRWMVPPPQAPSEGSGDPAAHRDPIEQRLVALERQVRDLQSAESVPRPRYEPEED